MAFVVEDGSGLVDATAYTTTAFADDYHADRGNIDWAAAAVGDKQTALIAATTYVEGRFGRRFRGRRKLKEQALEWPRLDAFDDDGFAYDGVDVVPRKLQQAIAEYALRALSAPLVADPAASESTGQVTASTKKVGPIEVSTSFDANTATHTNRGTGQVPGSMLPAYPDADMQMEELLKPRSTSILRA